MKRKIALLLAAVLLLACFASCAKKDPAKLKFASIYLNVATLMKTPVKHYMSSEPNVRSGIEWKKDVNIEGIAYSLTMTDIEDVISSDNLLLSQRDQYYKAGSADGSSPKISAVFEHDTGALLHFTIDAERYYNAIRTGQDLADLFENVLSSNVPLGLESNPTILTYDGTDLISGFASNGEAYIVSQSWHLEGYCIGSASLTMTKSGFRFDSSLSDVSVYQKYLAKTERADVIKAAQDAINAQLGEDSEGVLTVTGDKLVFALVGGRPCFTFDGTFEKGGTSAEISALFFLRYGK